MCLPLEREPVGGAGELDLYRLHIGRVGDLLLSSLCGEGDERRRYIEVGFGGSLLDGDASL